MHNVGRGVVYGCSAAHGARRDKFEARVEKRTSGDFSRQELHYLGWYVFFFFFIIIITI